jgi:alginate O-acetyltransferase complex protein AlgI
VTFVQREFLILMALTWLVYWRLPRRAQNVLLVGVSAVFYGWVHPWFLALLAVSALTDFVAAVQMTRRPERKRAWLVLSLAVNFGMLGFFKYFDFFLFNVDTALGAVGLSPGLGPLGILLPVGISFYTFQTVSYTLDVYRGQLQACEDVVDYLVFVMFFPQLVAGPIERAGDMLPQVTTDRRLVGGDQVWGVTLALWGAFQKVVIADSLAPYVDATYALPAPETPLLLAATVAFSIQIVADFGGYSDMARGTARMLGFRLTRNFREPYLATSPTDAWGRWHVTFATWLRDYVYFPLASAAWLRRLKLPFVRDTGAQHLARVTLVTFLLAGLWHGAAWHFVLWGLYNAALVILFAALTRRAPRAWRGAAWLGWVGPPAMYLFTLFGFVLFREPEVARIGRYLSQAPWAASREGWVAAVGVIGVSLLAALPYLAALLVRRRVLAPVWERVGWLPVFTGLWAWLGWMVWLFHREDAADHIYFQF